VEKCLTFFTEPTVVAELAIYFVVEIL